MDGPLQQFLCRNLHKERNGAFSQTTRTMGYIAWVCKVELVVEEREVAFLSSSKNSENLNFSSVHSGKIQIFRIFAGW